MGCMTTEPTPVLILKHDLPDHLGVPRQPDGSLAQVSVKVEAVTLKLAKAALVRLREDLGHYSAAWASAALTEEQLTKLMNSPDDSVPEFALDAMERLHDDFLQLPAVVQFNELTEFGVTTHNPTVTVSSPSVVIAVRSVLEMLEPSRLAIMLRDVA